MIKNIDVLERYLSPAEVVKYCKDKYNIDIKESAIYNAKYYNLLKCYKPFGYVRVKVSDLENYIESTLKKKR